MALTLLVLALAVSALSITVTRSKVTNGMREHALRLYQPLGNLLSCPYCFSHWAAFAASLACPLHLVPGGALLNLIVSTFAIVGLSAIITGACMQLLHAHETIIERLTEENDGLADDLSEARAIIQQLTTPQE